MAKSEAAKAARRRYRARLRGKLPRPTPAELHTRLLTLDLETGFRYLEEEPQRRQIDGFWVESKYKSTKLQMFRAGRVQCVECGVVGTHWHFERHRNDTVMPFYINLYATVGEDEVMLTWDHKVPRSLGGSNNLANAQCMCDRCNSLKGNSLSIAEMLEYQEGPEYFSMLRLPAVTSRLADTINTVLFETNNFSEVNNVF